MFKTALFLISILASVSFADIRPPFPVFSDSRGLPIRIIVDPSISDLAQAHLNPPHPNGQPVIYYNESLGSKFPQAFLTFSYFHEIAHHQLGHLYLAATGLRPYSIRNDFVADSHAVHLLIQAGFSIEEFQEVFLFLSQIPATDAEHPAGIERVKAMQMILEQSGFAITSCNGLLFRSTNR